MGDFVDTVKFRPAQKSECRIIAELFSIASDGVADCIWTKYAEPGENIFEFGAKHYASEDSVFSYTNCTVADLEGKIIGILVAFPMHESEDEDSDVDPILAPYMKLEQYNSYYICAMALFPEYRGKGVGTKFLQIAEQQAVDNKLTQLSLIVFEQNEGAKRLYERHGYYEIKREPVVPHELIHYTGYALLMVKDIP
jgi:ribosomal protein S18 acetylase RimI-like enzyme